MSCEPRKPPPPLTSVRLSPLSPCLVGVAAVAAFPLWLLDGVGVGLSSSLSSPSSRSFLFMQVTARRSRWLRIVFFSCCSIRKNASILSWVFANEGEKNKTKNITLGLCWKNKINNNKINATSGFIPKEPNAYDTVHFFEKAECITLHWAFSKKTLCTESGAVNAQWYIREIHQKLEANIRYIKKKSRLDF